MFGCFEVLYFSDSLRERHCNTVNNMDISFLSFHLCYRFGSSPTPFHAPLPSAFCLSFTVFLCVAVRAYCRESRGRWWRRSQIIRPRESLVLYKSFNTLFYAPEAHIIYFTGSSWFLISFVMGGSGPSRAIKEGGIERYRSNRFDFLYHRRYLLDTRKGLISRCKLQKTIFSV